MNQSINLYPNLLNLNDPKIKRRFIILGESNTRLISIAEIGASKEVDDLICIIDGLVNRLYNSKTDGFAEVEKTFVPRVQICPVCKMVNCSGALGYPCEIDV